MIATLFLPAVLVLITALYLSIRKSRVSKFMREIGGPPQIPILGNGLDFNIPNEDFCKLLQWEWPRKYGPRYTFSIGLVPYFTSSKPSDLEKLLSSTTEIEKGTEYSFLDNWLGEGLLLSKGTKWFRRRKMITPSFHFKILDEFNPTFNRNSAIMIDLLRRECMEGRQTVEINRYITLCTLDIICETAMGRPVRAQQQRDSDYVRAIYELNASLQYRSVRPWVHSDFIWYKTAKGRKDLENLKILHGFTENVIREKKLERQNLSAANNISSNSAAFPEESDTVYMKKKQAVAFMDTLLEFQANNPDAVSDVDIREEVDTFMFEGHDTTSASLAWTILLLASNPDCQEKVHEELDRIFGDDKDSPVTSAELAQLKYLEYCIKESLRLYPSVPFLARHLKNDLKLDNEVTVPSGVNFCMLSLSIHRNPEIFPDPEAFKPERFFPENAAGRHPYAYIPFSAGQRNCIGQKFALMEEKVVLAQIFRNFRVEAVDTSQDVVVTMEIITRPRDGIKVKLHPR